MCDKLGKCIILLLYIFFAVCCDSLDSRIVLIGDSIAKAFDVNLFFPNNICENRGVNGLTISGLIGNHISCDCDVIVIIGTNNITGQISDESLLQIASDEERVLNGIGGRRLFIVSVLPTSDSIKNERILAYNKLIARMASCNPKMFYIECYEELCYNNLLNPEYSRDGIHINDYGYAIIAEKINDRL